MTEKRFDLIIFGVTGFCGVYCLRNIFKVNDTEDKQYRFAVAGRSRLKILTVLDQVGKDLKRNLAEEIEIIEADVFDSKSLINMTNQCQVLINAVGPYIEYGRPVIEACLETGTHHVDLSAEPQFLESIQFDFYDKAKEKGVYIIGSCGFDSIPCDMGVQFLKKSYPDIRFNQVEGYILMKDSTGNLFQPINNGTFDSLVAVIKDASKLVQTFQKSKEKFFTRPFRHQFIQKSRMFVKKDTVLKKWTMPFFDNDKWVIRRTQNMLFAQDANDYPVQFDKYLYIPNPWLFVGIAMYAPFFILFCYFSLSRKVVLRYPKFFTFGKFGSGPTDQQIKNSFFEKYLVAKGWKKDELQGQEPTAKPNETRILQVKGPEAAYDATSIFILVSTITILEELKNNNVCEPGVLTPGMAFRHTKLIERLRKYNIEFNLFNA